MSSELNNVSTEKLVKELLTRYTGAIVLVDNSAEDDKDKIKRYWRGNYHFLVGVLEDIKTVILEQYYVESLEELEEASDVDYESEDDEDEDDEDGYSDDYDDNYGGIISAGDDIENNEGREDKKNTRKGGRRSDLDINDEADAGSDDGSDDVSGFTLIGDDD